MTDFATISRLAKSTGLARPTIKRAIEAAGIVPRGKSYPVAEVMAALNATTDPARVAGHASIGRGDAPVRQASALADARAQSETYRAQKLELEVRRRAGELVERAQVKEAGVTLVTQTRVALLAVPSKVAPKLLGLSDALAAQRIVDEAIRDALASLADPDAFIAAVLA